MADNLEQMKISVENDIKMFTLAERESESLQTRNKHSELEKCKANIQTIKESSQDLKYNVQEIMTEKDEEARAIDAYAEQLEERILKYRVCREQFNCLQIVRKQNPGAERINYRRWNFEENWSRGSS